VRRLVIQLQRLERLTQNLLNLTRFTHGQIDMRPEPVDLVALTRDIVETFAADFAESNTPLELVAEAPIEGSWDPLRIGQVLTNLLSNAGKFGRGKPIEVALGQDTTTAWVRVRDAGIGICAADQQRIFERFQQAASAQGHGGFGLGLWISKQIVEAMGGSMQVDSAPSAGCTFTVRLPK
jgi:signal transduction histidine kinase